MIALNVIEIGDSLGVIIPEALVQRLGMKEGDTLYAIQTQEGLRLVPADPEFVSQMEVARRIMRERRSVFRALAEF